MKNRGVSGGGGGNRTRRRTKKAAENPALPDPAPGGRAAAAAPDELDAIAAALQIHRSVLDHRNAAIRRSTPERHARHAVFLAEHAASRSVIDGFLAGVAWARQRPPNPIPDFVRFAFATSEARRAGARVWRAVERLLAAGTPPDALASTAAENAAALEALALDESEQQPPAPNAAGGATPIGGK